ncbi:activated RNA polymerase II transcriptional coactivator p15 isoform X1 [Hyla sarda]|uniref:activated RNA polymerase II transcriptional coactivator p15 isoform X1 n=1 Tax=Hyla sarda TaxID=327740 RepID=UPI0024C3443C|nr:activated RNA polymerase II transcriptional coactivator p15 isoform X1 [Hyla sarda]
MHPVEYRAVIKLLYLKAAPTKGDVRWMKEVYGCRSQRNSFLQAHLEVIQIVRLIKRQKEKSSPHLRKKSQQRSRSREKAPKELPQLNKAAAATRRITCSRYGRFV